MLLFLKFKKTALKWLHSGDCEDNKAHLHNKFSFKF